MAGSFIYQREPQRRKVKRLAKALTRLSLSSSEIRCAIATLFRSQKKTLKRSWTPSAPDPQAAQSSAQLRRGDKRHAYAEPASGFGLSLWSDV